MTQQAIWVPCRYCDDYWCKKHNMHAHECECPPIDEMTHYPYTGDPYSEKSQEGQPL